MRAVLPKNPVRFLPALLVMLLALAVPPAQAQDTTSNLVGHWKLDETTGTTAADSSGNGYDGTLSSFTSPNESWRPGGGAIDGALWMNHSDDEYIDVDAWQANFDFNTNYTLSAWVYLDDNGQDHYIIKRGAHSTASAWQQYLMKVAPDGVLSFTTGDSAVADVDTYGQVEFGRWQHLACVEDAGTKRCYVNGEQSGSDQANSVPGPFSSGSPHLYIGRLKGSADDKNMNGMLDDVRIYDRPLSATDIKALYARSNKFCDSPFGVPGELRYNADRAALQYCDGDSWVMAGLGSYTPVAVNFDGSTTSASVTGASADLPDTKKVTGSFWLRTSEAAGDSSYFIQVGSNSYFRLGTDSVGREIEIVGRNGGGTSILVHKSTNPINDGQWHHVMFSYDLTDSNKAHLVIDGVVDASVPGTYTDDLMAINGKNIAVGQKEDLTNGHYDGDVADFWLDFDTYIDLSDASMRAKFLSPNNMPMYLGADGSLPTGEVPEIFLSGDVATWHTNKGSGGGFTENGTLTAGEKIPLTAAPDLTTGLLGHWKLDETSGTTANDSSGNTFNGSMLNGLSGATNSVSGVMVNALDLDGTDDYALVSHNAAFDNLNDITIAAWIRRDNTNNVYDPILSKTNSAGNYPLTFEVCDSSTGSCGASDNNKLSLYSNKTSPSQVTSSATITDTDWHFVAVTRSGTDVTFYIDGVEAGTATMSNSFGADALNLRIGRESGATPPFDGKLDDVRLYNRALSAGEIGVLYAGTCSGPSGAGGTIIYNTDHKVMQYCNGVEWVAMSKIGGTGGGGCSSPAGVAGEIFFNSSEEVMQYCNSEDWVNIGKSNVPTSGLVAHYRMDETSGTNVENADNPGTYDGTFSGEANVVSAAGKVATALTFDGIDDRVTVTAPAGLADLGPASWAFWVYRNSTADGALLYKSDNNSDEGWWIDFDSGFGGIGFTAVYASGNLRRYNSAPGVGQWFHVVITWEGTSDSASANIYINGEITGIDGTDDNGSGTHVSDATRDLLIGDGSNGSSENFNGRLDDIRIYDRVLSAGEVLQLYNATN